MMSDYKKQVFPIFLRPGGGPLFFIEEVDIKEEELGYSYIDCCYFIPIVSKKTMCYF